MLRPSKIVHTRTAATVVSMRRSYGFRTTYESIEPQVRGRDWPIPSGLSQIIPTRETHRAGKKQMYDKYYPSFINVHPSGVWRARRLEQKCDGRSHASSTGASQHPPPSSGPQATIYTIEQHKNREKEDQGRVEERKRMIISTSGKVLYPAIRHPPSLPTQTGEA